MIHYTNSSIKLCLQNSLAYIQNQVKLLKIMSSQHPYDVILKIRLEYECIDSLNNFSTF